jgi:pyrrolidone-carboxylate peptidase
MKFLALVLLFSFPLFARDIVLVGYFDPFGKASFNNSERAAKDLESQFKNHAQIQLELCALNTVFDKSFHQLEDCAKALREEPRFVLGLGEANCSLKFEILARNFDKTLGPDNEGNERRGPIDPSGKEAIGLNYPLPDMYCALSKSERKEAQVSNNAGSFVCNNLAYQFADNYPRLNFGFIHVPSHNCRNLKAKTDQAVKSLVKMIERAVTVSDFNRLPTHKEELKDLRETFKHDPCLSEFYSRARGIDEKGFWPFSN